MAALSSWSRRLVAMAKTTRICHGDQRWMGCAGAKVGACRLSALSDAAQKVAVVCPGDVSRGSANRRDGSSGAGLLRHVSQRVCGQGAEGRGAVALSEFGDVSRAICGESTALPATDRPLCWSERHLP